MVDRRDPRVLPLRHGPVDHQIDSVVLVHRLQQMEPAERKQMAFRLLKSLRDRRESDSESHKLLIVIEYYAASLVRDKLQDLARLLVNLLLGERDEVIDGLRETLVIDIEEVSDHLLVLLEFVQTPLVQVVPLLQKSRDPRDLLLKRLVRGDLVLHPVAFLHIAKGCDEVIVVRIVVQTVERRDVLVALDQHALFPKGVVVQRSMDLVHSVLLGPRLGGAEKKFGHLEVIDRVKPSEAGSLLVIERVITRVNHSANTSDNSLAIHDHPHFSLAIRKGGDFGQRFDLVAVKSGNILRTVFVQLVRELDEFHQIPSAHNLNYFIIRHKYPFYNTSFSGRHPQI